MSEWRDTRIEMMGGNTAWVRVTTVVVMQEIRKYLRRHPKARYLTMNKLAKAIGEDRKTVKNALNIMAYRKVPEIRLRAVLHYGKSHLTVAYHIHPITSRNVGDIRRKKK